ncbi:hypothetical protein OUZ56_000374 [Daphnia magna]|uniref:Uncharacterized protein n=1 Tax=Daphnia magna TaxID=35525 RepID=A0ABQ9ZZG9_9CRUS|nr:hypothetical protein OUZ56_000374 [Daphnia magna]
MDGEHHLCFGVAFCTKWVWNERDNPSKHLPNKVVEELICIASTRLLMSVGLVSQGEKKGRTESQNVRGKKKGEEENDVSDDSVRSKINTNSIFAPPPSPPSSFRLLPL